MRVTHSVRVIDYVDGYFINKDNSMRNEKLDILKKELRKNLTESEAIVWSILRNRKFMNLKFSKTSLLQQQ